MASDPTPPSADSPLTPERLRAALGTRPFQLMPRTASTNDDAREWAMTGAPAGAVVVAEEQIAGRGRFGRAWIAPPGTALLFSVVLRPTPDPARIAQVPMAGAVAVIETLRALPGAHPATIDLKWPNDVHIAGRKVAGILSESTWQGEMLQAVILGIGINVRVDFTSTPLAETATSIEPALGIRVDRAALLADLLESLGRWVARAGEEALFAAWRAALTTLGRRVTVRSLGAESQVIGGLAVDVAGDGALLLRAGDGSLHRVVAGDVTLESVG
jgi:BirA family biotin operon repressor/biotin-[acetyl-CoA-carboxylase] ligase